MWTSLTYIGPPDATAAAQSGPHRAAGAVAIYFQRYVCGNYAHNHALLTQTAYLYFPSTKKCLWSYSIEATVVMCAHSAIS